MSRRMFVDFALRNSYDKLMPNVPSQWQKFVASVFLHAVVMAWE